MNNKFTLNEAFKERFIKRKKLDIAVLLLLLIFIIFNIMIQTRERKKIEDIALSSITWEDTIFESYNNALYQEGAIYSANIHKFLDIIKKTDSDEVIFLPESIQLFYIEDYKKDLDYLKENFKSVYISSIDESGIKIEVKYE